MNKNSKEKRMVRERMKRTGQTYMQALADIRTEYAHMQEAQEKKENRE